MYQPAWRKLKPELHTLAHQTRTGADSDQPHGMTQANKNRRLASSQEGTHALLISLALPSPFAGVGEWGMF